MRSPLNSFINYTYDQTMDTSPSSNNFYSLFLSHTFLPKMRCLKDIEVARNVQCSEVKPRRIDTPTTSWCDKKNRLVDGRFWDLSIILGMLNYIQHYFLAVCCRHHLLWNRSAGIWFRIASQVTAGQRLL